MSQLCSLGKSIRHSRFKYEHIENWMNKAHRLCVVATTKLMFNRSTNGKSQKGRYLVEIQVVYS